MANVTQTLTADGSLVFIVDDGKEAGFSISGDFGGGTLNLADDDGVVLKSYTSEDADVAFCVSDVLEFTLSGSTAPNLQIRLARAEQ